MNECCRDKSNLVPSVAVADLQKQDKKVLVCRVCGRRHIRFTVDAGDFRAKLEIGREEATT